MCLKELRDLSCGEQSVFLNYKRYELSQQLYIFENIELKGVLYEKQNGSL